MYLQINDLKQVIEGAPRGAITEVLGAPSSGRTSLVDAFLAASTTAGEVDALIDFADSFDPASAERAGAELKNLIWVQCGRRLEHAMRAADLVLHSGGFGLVVLDLCDASPELLQHVPVSYWHRFRLAVKNTPTAVVVAGNQPNARSCAQRQIELEPLRPNWAGRAPFQRLDGLRFNVRSRKPVAPATVELQAGTSEE
jgi:hypothetical protein